MGVGLGDGPRPRIVQGKYTERKEAAGNEGAVSVDVDDDREMTRGIWEVVWYCRTFGHCTQRSDEHEDKWLANKWDSNSEIAKAFDSPYTYLVSVCKDGCAPYGFPSRAQHRVIFSLSVFINVKMDFKHQTKQHGAAEARRAHNPEVPRSKRGVASFFSLFFASAEMAPV